MNKFKGIIFLAITFFHQGIHAAEGGYSNYIPGFYGDIALAMAPESGLSFKNDIYYYSASTSKTVLGDKVAANVDIDLRYFYASIIYVSDLNLFGAKYASMMTVPYGGPDINAKFTFNNVDVSFNDDAQKVGDLTFAPIMLYWNDGNFNYSFAEYIVAPTASYDKSEIANPGLNYWTFETDFSASYTNSETGQDYSILAGYNYNTENNKTDYQTGQEFHVDFVVNQFLSETFAIGIQGFHLQQTTKDRGDGARLGGFKARASGIGPSLVWLPAFMSGSMAVTAKWIKEIDSKHRLEGDHVFVTLAFSP